MVDPQHEVIGTTARTIGVLGIMGVVIALGQLLRSGEPMTWKIAIGRAICVAAVAIAAAGVIAVVPDLPLAGQIGIGAGLASLGTSGLEKALDKVLDKILTR